MQYSSIELKSSKYVLTLVMDPSVPFERILSDVKEKFLSSARFFKGAQMALEFKGRELTDQQQHEVSLAITSNCGLDIICILQEADTQSEKAQYEAITDVLKGRPEDKAGPQDGTAHPSEECADIVKGSVKNGQKVFCDRSVLILGDVDPMAEVSCSGSIFVAGQAVGTLRAGLDGDENSFVAALVLKAKNLELCGHKGFTGIRKKSIDGTTYPAYPQMITLDGGHLKTETISAGAWNHLFEKIKQRAQEDADRTDPSSDLSEI